ncbi:MAG: glutathione synthase [Candidatus Omnitrophica bacterium]|nr:glutathione synthase [Candidatus Omnitrophota bacterium]
MKIAFLLYPTEKVKPDEDSSFWIMHELQRRGHEVSYFQHSELLWSKGSPHAFLRKPRLNVKKGFLPSPVSPEPVDLSQMHCVFIRKEPPFNKDYLYALQLLRLIKDKVFMVNDPDGIALANEKLFTLAFSKHIPETLVTERIPEAVRFIRTLHKRAVVKPLHEKGGAGIFVTSFSDRNLPSLLEMATRRGQRKVLIQRFLPTERFGDKRLLVLDGKILGAFIRKPSRTDFRANLSAGGTMHRAEVNGWDKKIVGEMAPVLERHGLFFVGLDVIGKALTEINVTSPAGIPEINALNGVCLETKVADFIEERCHSL